MRNVEIKARISDYDKICNIAEELSGGPATVIIQDDTFYHVNSGRLKMRFSGDSSATLVRYDRENTPEAKQSDYDLVHFSVSEAEKARDLDSVLKKCLGAKGRVVKERKLYMVGQTRVHIDAVQDLGHFMELEVVLKPEQTVAEGRTIARELQSKLGVKNEDLIDCAYLDLLKEKSKTV